MSNQPEYPQTLPPMYAQTSTMAIVSLIAGIVSWILLPLIGAIVAVITGHMAKSEIRNNSGRLTGDGLATAGMILGYLQIGLTIVGLCCVAALIATGTLAALPSIFNQH